MKFLFTTILLAWLGMSKPTTEISFSVETSKSTVNWTGYYLFNFGEHRGSINIKEGELKVSDSQLIGGKIIIDMTTLDSTDPGMEGSDGLSDHLKSADFFEVDKFPTAVLEILEVKPFKDAPPTQPNVEIIGMLTMKGIRQQIKFPALLAAGETQILATGRFKFDRTKWNVKYNSGKYFDNIGDDAISDAIGISFDIVATPKSH